MDGAEVEDLLPAKDALPAQALEELPVGGTHLLEKSQVNRVVPPFDGVPVIVVFQAVKLLRGSTGAQV